MKHFILLTLFAFSSAQAEEAVWSLRGNVRNISAFDTKHDDPVEHYFEDNVRLFAEGKVSKENWAGVVSLLGRYTVATPHDTKTYFNADLYEAYIRFAQGFFAFEAGERVVRWGVMEYVSPTDKLNPRDIRQYIAPEVEDTYLPVPMLRVVMDEKPWNLELIYQPFFRRSEFDVIGSDTAFIRPSVQKALGLPVTDIGSTLDDGVERNLSDTIAEEPGDNPLKGEGGGRFGFSIDQLDVSFMYLNKRDTLPTIDLPNGIASLGSGVASGAIPRGDYRRSHLAGTTLRRVFDNGITLKGEGLYQSASSFFDEDLFLKRETLLQWATGFEYDWDLQHLFTLEYAQDRVLTGNTQNYFLRDIVQHFISAAAIFNFKDRTYTVELKGTSIPNQQAYLLDPSFFYRPVPAWEFSVGTQIYGGNQNSIFGLISNNNLVYVTAKYLF